MRRNLCSIGRDGLDMSNERPPEVPVRNGVLERVDNVKRVEVDLN